MALLPSMADISRMWQQRVDEGLTTALEIVISRLETAGFSFEWAFVLGSLFVVGTFAFLSAGVISLILPYILAACAVIIVGTVIAACFAAIILFGGP